MPSLPKQIGRYLIRETLGQGGMGTVFLAEDPVLRRPVALKVIHALFGERETALARFRLEAEVSASLNHPNVITVYDVGEDPALGPFMAMEYVDGESFQSFLRRDSVTPAELLRVLIQARRGLEAAHDAGIIHRDVKSQNVLVSKQGRAKLTDFGLAKETDSTLTLSGSVLGTPAYLAPEQVAGEPASVATDRYAFFVLTYEALVRRLPFEGTSISAVLYAVSSKPPEIPPTVSPALASVFATALAKSPAERFATLEEFLRRVIEAIDLEVLDVDTRRRLVESLDEESSLSDGVGAPAQRSWDSLGPVGPLSSRGQSRAKVAEGSNAAVYGVFAAIAVLGLGGIVVLVSMLGGEAASPPPATLPTPVETETVPIASPPDPTATAEPRPTEEERPPIPVEPTLEAEPTDVQEAEPGQTPEVAPPELPEDLPTPPEPIATLEPTVEETPERPLPTPRLVGPRWHRVLRSTDLLTRAGPDAEVITRLRKGIRIRIVGRKGPYLRVESLTGREPGYVLEEDTQLTK